MLPYGNIELIYQNAVPQTAFGLLLMSFVLIIDGYGFVGTMRLFRANVGQSAHPSKLKATFFFVLCIQMLALTQLARFAFGLRHFYYLALFLTGLLQFV